MLKRIFFISIFAVGVFAAENIEMNSQNMYDILKPQMSKMYKSIIPMMQRAKECFLKANSKQEALKCSQMMVDESAKFMPGFSKEAFDKENFKDFEWNEKIKKETIESLEKSAKEMEKMQNCIEKSKTMQDIDTCMKEVGISKE